MNAPNFVGNSSTHSLHQASVLAAGTVRLLDNAVFFSPECSRISAPPSAWAAGSPADWTARPSSQRGAPVANRGRPALGSDCLDQTPDRPDPTPDCSDPVAVVKPVPTAARRKCQSVCAPVESTSLREQADRRASVRSSNRQCQIRPHIYQSRIDSGYPITPSIDLGQPSSSHITYHPVRSRPVPPISRQPTAGAPGGCTASSAGRCTPDARYRRQTSCRSSAVAAALDSAVRGCTAPPGKGKQDTIKRRTGRACRMNL